MIEAQGDRVKRESKLSLNVIIARFFFLPRLKVLKVLKFGFERSSSCLSSSLYYHLISSPLAWDQEINRKTKTAYLSCLGFLWLVVTLNFSDHDETLSN